MIKAIGKIRGFTLIELLIVLVVIGIIASLAIPSYNAQIERMRAVEAIKMIEAIRNELSRYKQETGIAAYNISDLNITNCPESDASAVEMGLCWWYLLPHSVGVLPDGKVLVSYSIIAKRSSKDGGGPDHVIVLRYSDDDSWREWYGTHSGVPKNQ